MFCLVFTMIKYGPYLMVLMGKISEKCNNTTFTLPIGLKKIQRWGVAARIQSPLFIKVLNARVYFNILLRYGILVQGLEVAI